MENIVFELIVAVLGLGAAGFGFYSWNKNKKPTSQTSSIPSRKDYITLEEALAKTKEGFWGKSCQNSFW